MSIAFDQHRWQRVRESYAAWWAGTLDRPLLHLSAGGRDPGRPRPNLPSYWFHSFYDLTIPAEAVVDLWDYELATRVFLGDAFPERCPNFGPGVIAAFLGADLSNGTDTVWFHPRELAAVGELRFDHDADNRWLPRLRDLYRAALDHWGGLVQLGVTDLGGAVDILATFRPSENLLFDLYDDPEAVTRQVWTLHDSWWHYFTAFTEILAPLNPGYSCWAPIFSSTPYYMLQCDFAYMISPEMFAEFVLPELAASCRRLDHAFYHLDGPGQLSHLDTLLAIPELKGIQWIPGAGSPDVSQWPEVYRAIRDAGKLVQVFTSQYPGGFRIIDVLADQLGSAEGIIVIGEVEDADLDEAYSLMRKYGIE